MPAALDLGGNDPILVRRVLSAENQWIPHATLCTVTDFQGNAILAAVKAAVGTHGFFMAENVAATVVFSDYGASTGLCVQIYDPIGDAWFDAETWVEDDPHPAKRIMGPMTEWRAGVKTGGVLVGTPTVLAIYNRVMYGRHA